MKRKIKYLIVMTFVAIPLMPIILVCAIIYFMFKYSRNYWSNVWYDTSDELKYMKKQLINYFLILTKNNIILTKNNIIESNKGK